MSKDAEKLVTATFEVGAAVTRVNRILHFLHRKRKLAARANERRTRRVLAAVRNGLGGIPKNHRCGQIQKMAVSHFPSLSEISSKAGPGGVCTVTAIPLKLTRFVLAKVGTTPAFLKRCHGKFRLENRASMRPGLVPGTIHADKISSLR
jgi:hypothetical protein